jgi:hypothetical protein
VNADELRNLETEVMKAGLAGLAELKDGMGDFVQVIAKIVNNWQTSPNRQGEWIDKHKFLRDLFAECDEADRGAMYSAIVPHLSFTALPLATYETMMTERMHKLVSKRAARAEGQAPHPVEVGGKKYVEASAALATHAIAKVHCRCGKKKVFLAGTPVGAMIAARQAGWRRIADRETCPHCVKKLMTVRPDAKVS